MAGNIGRFFLDADEKRHVSPYTEGNTVDTFTDDRILFQSMLADMLTATGQNDFVYFANWWCDLAIPLGDPRSRPPPPSLRQVLKALSDDKPVDAPSATSPEPPIYRGQRPGTQICAIVWQHKGQFTPATGLVITGTLGPVGLLYSLFGGQLLSEINREAMTYINSLSSDSGAILDDRTRAFGCHHQKLLVIGAGQRLVAYCGSADFNADRLYAFNSTDALHPPQTKGAPLSDVSVRIEGPAAVDVLETFMKRWQLHPDGKIVLRGSSFAPVSQSPPGPYAVQITHTYGLGYPFLAAAVRSSADALIRAINTAQRYIYFEDQYLVGTPELRSTLRNLLTNNIGLRVIAVAAPLSVVDDLPQLEERRSQFWGELKDLYKDRVRTFEMLADDGSDRGQGSYLHAKVTIVDDEVFSVGTVNCSRRSWSHDSEILATVAGTQPRPGPTPAVPLAAQLRIQRWSRHLAVAPSDLVDEAAAIARWSNLAPSARLREWQPGPVPSFSSGDTLAWDELVDPP